jgi:sec-independent protein translocase protein TatA
MGLEWSPMGGLSLMHWIVVLVLAMLFFGASRISDIGKGLGDGIRNFKKGLGSDDDQPPNDTKVAPTLASNKKKIIQVEVAEGEDEADALKKAAAEKAAENKAASEKR